MAARFTSKAVAFSGKLYERLLIAYPRGHREEYGPPMAQLFRDQCRDAWGEARNWALFKLWLRVLPDLLATSFLEHFSNLNKRKSMLSRILFGRALGPVYAFLTVFLLVFLSSVLITFLLPEIYRGTARIKVERDARDDQPQKDPPQQYQSSYDPYYIQTEFEVMQSEVVLHRVVDKLELNAKWAAKYGVASPLKTHESLELLKTRIDLLPVRNTTLIEIRAYSDEPEEAATLANAIAEAYREYRFDQNREWILGSINVLKDRWAEDEAKIQAAQDRVAKLRVELNVPVPEPAESVLAAHYQPYADAKQRLEDQRQLRTILGMKIAQQQTDLSLPKTAMVQIIDHAVANHRPVRPNKRWNIFLGTLLGIVLGSIAGGGIAGFSFLARRGSPIKPGSSKSSEAAA